MEQLYIYVSSSDEFAENSILETFSLLAYTLYIYMLGEQPKISRSSISLARLYLRYHQEKEQSPLHNIYRNGDQFN